ncbi:hypothetical protein FAZ19_19035 [Sphingobacterium alkalisoli]|uniref:Uncharacterized protein n=1 Tax=Sphingobacterium alkalisoli TaxID=1874115 RepID=A0A4V5LXI0_9SPHI|nr:hypothetical protein [Sphingobacterium alkalisoli]TJY62569.1 hypothetical protein FAZ19_19035 [Sphingobacterium alkalisoli]GGH27492.1 hypothetical protein GCM10011418_37470 [Sphingobacterium alkalisoli]
MKCESCNIKEIEVEDLADEGQNPFRLCLSCQNRLLNKALRPLEFFNLTAIHGHTYYLHDDFYNYDTGEATQSDIEVIDAEKFPFPDIEQFKDDLNRLIDFSFVQYFTNAFVITELQKFDKLEVLKRLKEKVDYNRAINYKAYEIAGKVVGKTAEEWIKKEWANRRENELQLFAEPIAKCVDFDDAFKILKTELESGDDKFLTENVSALLYFQSDKTLDWIEEVSERIKNISSSWGQLAASSQFTWERANNWLTIGRPLSLIALDSLIYCTTNGKRLNQSLWLRKLNPRLVDNPRPEVIANRLRNYLTVDSVPRTKNAVETIIENVFEATE